MSVPLRAIVWPGMPDGGALHAAAASLGRELELEIVSSNEDLERLLGSEPPFDLIFPSDYLVEKMAGENRLLDIGAAAPIDRDMLAEWCRHPAYDPDETHSVPFAFGVTGVLHRDGARLRSWKDFFEPENGLRVGLLDEVREVFGAALVMAGRSPNRMDAESLGEVRRILRLQSPAVASVSSDDFTGPVERGGVDAHQAWSGPASMAIRRDPSLGFAIPEEGALLWVTTAAVPADSPDPEAAIELIAALMDPDLARLAVENGGYSTPNAAARDLLGGQLRDDAVLFPPSDEIERCGTLSVITADEERAMLALWEETVLG